ncbi:MAG: protein kinase [Chloroflexi bacterium]|nr:protein kinase [Chloroflexota bacterium]
MDRKTDFKTGQKVDDYILELSLGGGQDGEVWRASKKSLGKCFAVKFLNSIDDADKLQRFDKEIQILASLNHPHIVNIFDKGEAWNPTTGGLVPYYVMEYLQARPLDSALAEATADEAVNSCCSLFQQLALAVSVIHEMGVTHGDIKPANVMVLPRERIAKLTDFGFGLLPGEVGNRAEYAGSSYRVPKGLSREEADVHRLSLTFKECLAGLKHKFSRVEYDHMSELIHGLLAAPDTTLLEDLVYSFEVLKYRSALTWESLKGWRQDLKHETLGGVRETANPEELRVEARQPLPSHRGGRLRWQQRYLGRSKPLNMGLDGSGI